MKYFEDQRVRVGGSKGPIMYIFKVLSDDDYVLHSEDERTIMYFHTGDCKLIPIKEKFEQLSLFEL